MQWPTLQDLRDLFGVTLLWLCAEWLILERPGGLLELWQRSRGRRHSCTAFAEMWVLGQRYIMASRDERTVLARLREREESGVVPLTWGDGILCRSATERNRTETASETPSPHSVGQD